jgi:hypothetical protein
MDYKHKYIKYKKKYLELNNIKSKYLMQQKIITGGNISWATAEYIDSIISSKIPDKSRCDLIQHIKAKKNEGRHNDGIGFINIDGKQYFLKYGDDLFNDFKTGYQLSKLRSEYPYFLNVYSLLECDYVPSNGKSKKGQVMVVDKGSETIYNYLNRKSKEYILNLIPDLEAKVNKLDEKIIKIINDLTDDEKKLFDFQLEKKDKKKYDLIISEINELVKKFYLSLSREIIQFQTEFVPLFLQNYKALIDSYMIVDIFTLNKYNNYISDKKSDNYMVKTEPYVENKTHVNIKLGSTDIRINNICEWHNTKEYCFLYPVDFGSGGNMDYPKLDKGLLSYFLNEWISRYSRLEIYSDILKNNLESGNILFTDGDKIKFNFSKFSSDNEITNLNLKLIFDKYNPFKIKIFNPLRIYVEGMESMIDDKKELQMLLEKNPLKENDFRSFSKKLFNINTLEEACEILQILLNGSTVIFDNYHQKYRRYSSTIDFRNINGLPNVLGYFSEKNVYKTFTII